MKKILFALLLSISVAAICSVIPPLVLLATPKIGPTPLTVQFDAVCATCEVYTWDFGDGSGPAFSPGPVQVHQYARPGTFYVIVASTTRTGAGLAAKATITVNPDCKSIYADLKPGEFYTLPKWKTDLTWIAPADFVYQATRSAGLPDPGRLPSIGAMPYDRGYFCMTLLVAGGKPPYTYSGQNLPAGLTVSPDGTYTGLATKPGTYSNILFCATDAAGTKVCLQPRSQNVCKARTKPCS